MPQVENGREFFFLFFGFYRRERLFQYAHLDSDILQIAFARLITDRTIERMVQKHKLQHLLPLADDFFGVRAHDHPLTHRRVARGHRPFLTLYLHDAYPASAYRRNLGKIAEGRNIDSDGPGGLENGGPFFDADVPVIYCQINHYI